MSLKRVLEVIVFSNVWVSIAATAATAVSLRYFNVSMRDNTSILLFVFSSTFFVYNFQRLWRLVASDSNLNHRLQWIEKHRRKLGLLSATALIAVGLTISEFSLEMILTLVICGIISVLYVVKIIRSGSQKLMLREVPYLKIFIVSLIWTIMTVVLPLEKIWNLHMNAAEIIFLCMDRFLFIFAITLPFDIRDLPHDENDGLKTITRSIGIKATKRLSIGLLLVLCMIHLIYPVFFGDFDVTQHIMVIISCILTSFIIQRAGSDRKELFYSGLVESTVIFQWLLISLPGWIA